MKKMSMLLIALTLFVSGCTKELNVQTKNHLIVEYGTKLSYDSLFDAKKSDDHVKVSNVDGFQPKKIGKQVIDVTFTDGNREVKKQVNITVSDTKKPVITLHKDTVTINEGDEYSFKDNILSVKDVVDGELKYSESNNVSSTYFIDSSSVDVTKAGSYTIHVVAYDANKNKSQTSFTLNVQAKKEESKPIASSPTNNTTTPPTTPTQPQASPQTQTKPQTPTQTPSNKPIEDTSVSSDSLIAKAALAQVGGQASCSSVAEYAINAVGKSAVVWEKVELEDGSITALTYLTPESFTKMGVKVDPSQMRAGDILYYADGGMGFSHVAVYLGNGKAVHGGWMGSDIVVASIHFGSGVSGVYRFD